MFIKGNLITGLTNLIFGIIEILLALRIVFKFFGANESANFVQWILANTDPLIAPFEGIFPSPSLGNVFVLEISTVFALIVYAIASFVITEFIQILESGKRVNKQEGK